MMILLCGNVLSYIDKWISWKFSQGIKTSGCGVNWIGICKRHKHLKVHMALSPNSYMEPFVGNVTYV